MLDVLEPPRRPELLHAVNATEQASARPCSIVRMSNWLKRLFGGGSDTPSEPTEPATAPEPATMPSEPDVSPPVSAEEPAATEEPASDVPAGDEPA
jgi:hypothetical protein